MLPTRERLMKTKVLQSNETNEGGNAEACAGFCRDVCEWMGHAKAGQLLGLSGWHVPFHTVHI